MELTYVDEITDAAQVGDVMYASTFSRLLRIDLNAKTISAVGSYGVGNINALTVDRQGQLYAAALDGNLYNVNTSTGQATKVMNMGYRSSGDLAFAPDGSLYATVRTSSSADALVRIVLATQTVQVVGSTGYADVYGLDYLYGTLYGRTNAGQIITVNPSTGQGTLVRATGLRFASLP